MTEYTFQQINEARKEADCVYDSSEIEDLLDLQYEWVETFVNSLGMDLKPAPPEKPVPGLYLHEGAPALVDNEGTIHFVDEDGDYSAVQWWDLVNPHSLIRYSPLPEAHAVELTEGQVGNLWNDARRYGLAGVLWTETSSWELMGQDTQDVVTDTVNAALRGGH